MKILLPAVAAVSLSLSACATRTPPETPAGANFLARNAAASKRVVQTASGLQYFIVKSGPKSGISPKDGDLVTFDYEGKLTNGTVFDSSFARGEPLTGNVGKFVKGFDEALKMMKPGDEWIVWIPPQLGYGDRTLDEIPAGSILRFRLALRSVTPA
ncbi:FKBP-type peptidyl-prolyl cis-trans isomerase [Sphingomonas rhizophila]|uniref:Peptidyl-prolyl cis-trans isomerase n=1 Tax=Sphingomonas rhizophila TaxID=2071607 RepID=A0A7G9SCU7_9SPHN|nr:FKBP-type peptidyl-prolyl cis-trans isomerase [Sphingomonas rhizophila]QNN65672.1 FKBP-type peptidyl-prolyl cis-trans isomerase [Sphingomonas rhizophila]